MKYMCGRKNSIKSIFILCFVMFLASCGGASDDRKNKYLEKGKVYLAENNLDKARIEFKNVLQIDPKFAEAYFYMGVLEERNKQLRKALSYYNGAIELKSVCIAPKVKVAKIYFVVGTKEYIEKSKEILKEVLSIDPDNAEANLILSTIDYKSGKQDKAIKDIELLLSKHGDMVEAISLLSTIHSSRGDVKKALIVLKNGIRKNPQDISLRMPYAKLLAKSNNNKEAEKQLKEIIQIKPEDFSFRVTLSRFYKFNGETDKAEAVLRKAIEDDADDASRYLALIEFIEMNKSLGNAEEELLAFISLKPELYELKFSLSERYIKAEEIEKAKSILKSLVESRSYKMEGVKARLRLAEVFFEEEKNISAALLLVKKVLEEYPQDNEALLLNGKISLQNNDIFTAINSLRFVLKNQPANTDVSLLLARAHFINGEVELAENVLKNSISINPKNHVAYYNYAKYLLENKKYSESSKVLDKALESFVDNYELMELKLSLMAALNNEPDLIELLNAMQEKHKDKGDIYIKRGKFYLIKKKYAEALLEFDKAYEKMVNKYRSLELIVHTYIVQKMPEKAIDRLMKIRNENPDNALAYQFLGVVYKGQNNYQKSRDNFILAIQKDNQWSVPYMDLAKLYLANNDNNKAINVYLDAIQNNVNVENVKIQLASLYEKDKKYQLAIKIYEEVLSANSKNLMVKNNLALLLVENDPTENEISRAVELVSEFANIKQPIFKDTMGWVYAKSGQSEKAIVVLEEVVKSSPNVAIFKYHLAVALNDSGNTSSAKIYLSQAIESKQDFMHKQKAIALLKQL